MQFVQINKNKTYMKVIYYNDIIYFSIWTIHYLLLFSEV
jgi:hypothetical protein